MRTVTERFGFIRSARQGFTIVELLIVIVVIAILAAIALVAYGTLQERAKVTEANTDMNTLVKAISVARLNKDTTLIGVTGNTCTGCSGTQASYDAAIDKIALASGMNLLALKKPDPWGNVYILDENEGEQPATPCTSTDALHVTNQASHTGLIIPRIPFYNCS